MRTRMGILILMLKVSSLGPSWTQEIGGVALSDGPGAGFINPATLARSRGLFLEGVALWRDAGGLDGFWSPQVQLITGISLPETGALAYSFDAASNRHAGHLAVVWGPVPVAFSYRYREPTAQHGWSLSSWFSPTEWLALGTHHDFDQYSHQVFWAGSRSGVALRPLAPLGVGTRLELYADVHNHWEKPLAQSSFGLRFQPLLGVVVSGEYRLLPDPSLSIGVLYRQARGDVAFTSTVTPGFEPQSFSLGVSAQTWQNQEPLSGGKIYYLKRANLITETTRVGSGLSPLFSNDDDVISLSDLMQAIQEAKNDPQVRALVIINQSLVTAFANIMPIRAALKEFKSAQKAILYYGDSISLSAYLLMAGIADEIVVHPSGSVGVQALSGTRLYFGDFLRRNGIVAENFPSHADKTAGNFLAESNPTEAERKQWERLLSRYQKVTLAILEERSQIADPVTTLRRGPWLAASAPMGLVDAVQTLQEFRSRLNRRFPLHLEVGNSEDVAVASWSGAFQPEIAVVYVDGDLVDQAAFVGQVDPSSFLSQLEIALQNPLTAGCVIRIDSGGGSVFASDEIARGLLRLRERYGDKPIYVSLGSVAASGGYYIAVAGDKIFAQRETLTGSIGVISLTLQIEKLLTNLGINAALLSQERPLVPNPLLPLTSEIRQKVQQDIQVIYNQFANFVKTRRSLTEEELERAAQARIWLGDEAKELKLVDEVGSLADAVREVASQRGLTNYRVASYVPSLRSRDTSLLVLAARDLGLKDAVNRFLRLRQLLPQGSAYLWWDPTASEAAMPLRGSW